MNLLVDNEIRMKNPGWKNHLILNEDIYEIEWKIIIIKMEKFPQVSKN